MQLIKIVKNINDEQILVEGAEVAAEKTVGFFKKAFQDMKESAKAQHEVDKANWDAAKAESKAQWEEAKAIGDPNRRKAVFQAERDKHIAEANERKAAAEAHGLNVAHHDKYGWVITAPGEALLDFVLETGLTDILINRNEFGGFRPTGTGVHSGNGSVAPRKPSSTRKYICPCCGQRVRATKEVYILCGYCGVSMEKVDT